MQESTNLNVGTGLDEDPDASEMALIGAYGRGVNDTFRTAGTATNLAVNGLYRLGAGGAAFGAGNGLAGGNFVGAKLKSGRAVKRSGGSRDRSSHAGHECRSGYVAQRPRGAMLRFLTKTVARSTIGSSDSGGGIW